jgi:signal transduction histidine kinase
MAGNTPARRRRLPTQAQLRTFRDFVETGELLRAMLAARLQSESDLSLGDYAVLLALSEAPDRQMRSSELAEHINWQRSRLSHHLGRMERRGLVRRQECASDSRGSEVVLTPSGAEAFRDATVPHLTAIRELFVDALTPAQLTAAADLAAALRIHLDYRVKAVNPFDAGGDLTARVPETWVREIHMPERVFNAMAGSLQATRTELAASRARIVASADEARRRIERDLHDGIQQRLVSLALDVRAVQSSVPAGHSELHTRLNHIADGLGGTLDELREISRGIHPAILSEGGLGPALKMLARRSAIPVEVDLTTESRLPPPVEVAAYYVVSEALTNAVKHARASVVQVDVQPRDGWLHLSVRDDGSGGADPAKGTGLIGLTDRIQALDGTITIRSPRGAGTTVQVDLPTTPS